MCRSIFMGRFVGVLLLCSLSLYAQQVDSGGSSSTSASGTTSASGSTQPAAGTIPRLVKFSGLVKDVTGNPATGTVGLTFSLYELPEGGTPLWTENQNLSLDAQGHYTALLGAESPGGLPLDLFTSSKALWLGVQPQLPGAAEQPRVLLVAVPYALKSSDADTLGGLPASAFVLASNGSASASAVTPGLPVTLPTPGPIQPPGSSSGPAGSGITGAGTTNYAAMFTGRSTIGSSSIYNSADGWVGIGTTNPTALLDVNGSAIFGGALSAPEIALPATTGLSAGVITLGGSPFLHAFGGSPLGTNTFVGAQAGNFIMTGNANTGSGYGALFSNTAGTENTANGYDTLVLNTTGRDNTANGYDALFSNTTGNQNTASGALSLFYDTTGYANTASGAEALTHNTTGTFNTGIGFYALGLNCSSLASGCNANWNTALGYYAGVTSDGSSGNITGASNTFLGAYSGPGTASDLNNATAVGANALVSESNALVLGSINGVNGATASVNVGIGTTAPQYTLDVQGTGNFTGPVNFAYGQTFSGNGAGLTDLTAANINAGTAGINITGNAATATSASGLTCVGCVGNAQLGVNYAGSASQGGPASNALLLNGLAASAFQPAGSYATLGANTFSAQQTISTGDLFITSGNLDLPSTAGATGGVITLGGNPFAHAFGYQNTFVGQGAGNFTMTGFGVNTASGSNAFNSNTTGHENTASGSAALYSNTTGNDNTGSGYQALVGNTTGSYNTALGAGAGVMGPGGTSSNTTGSYNTFVGAETLPTTTNLNNATAIGANAVVSESNAMVLGSINGLNGATASVYVGIGTTAPQYTLDVNGSGNFTGPVNFGSPVTFAASQTFPGMSGSGTVTSIAAGTGLASSPNPITSSGTISLASASCGAGQAAVALPLTCASFATLGANTFSAEQTIGTGDLAISNGNLDLSATTGATEGVITLGGNPFVHSYGSENTFLGQNAGNFSMTGHSNTASGYQALYTNTTGYGNAATGDYALNLNTTGYHNSAYGEGALNDNTTGINNTAIGTFALYYDCNNVSGACAASNNTAIGFAAGLTSNTNNANLTGANNTFLGYGSGPGTSTEVDNAAAIGADAVVSESNALVLGSISGVNGATASVNVGIGTATPQYSLDVNGTGNFTGAVNFGSPVTFAAGQTFPGTAAGGTVTSITFGAGLAGSPNPITSTGTVALASASCQAGQAAVALPLTCASFATLGANTFSAQQTISTGDLAISAGNLDLPATSGATGGVITLAGNPFAHAFGTANTFLGSSAGNFTMTGSANTAGGNLALNSNTTGNYNTALGANAGVTSTPSNANTTGSNNTFVGYNSGPGTSTEVDNATAIGANAVVSESNALVLGGTGSNAVMVGIGTTTPQYTLDVQGSGNFTGQVNFAQAVNFNSNSSTSFTGSNTTQMIQVVQNNASGVALTASNSADGTSGQLGTTTTGVTGTTSSGTNGSTAILGSASSTSGAVSGVLGTSESSTGGVGVVGEALSTTGAVTGVKGTVISTSNNAAGVVGNANGATGVTTGVVGNNGSTTDGAAGVAGHESGTTGSTYGVLGTTLSTSPLAAGVYGSANGGSGPVSGVYGTTNSTTQGASGVLGNATGTGGVGVTGTSTSGVGVSGSAPGTGVVGYATGTSGYAQGVYGSTLSPDGIGGVFVNGSGSATGLVLEGVCCSTSSGAKVFSVDGSGDGYFAGTVSGATSSTANGAAAVNGIASGTTGQTSGVSGSTNSSTQYAAGVYGTAASPTGIVYGVEGQNASSSGAGVFGLATNAGGTGVYGQGGLNGVYGFAQSVNGIGVAGSGSQIGVSGIAQNDAANAAGVFGSETAPTSGNAVYGVMGMTSSIATGSSGVYGYTSLASGQTYGVSGATNGTATNAAGVNGVASATTTTGQTYGVSGATSSNATYSAGVFGSANASSGQVYGVSGSTNSTSQYAAGVNGYEGATSGQVYGVNGGTSSTTDNSAGVNGSASGTTGFVSGVYGTTASPSGDGVYGINTATTAASNGELFGAGVFGQSNATTGYGVGVWGQTNSSGGVGVYGKTLGEGGTAGQFANTSGTGLVLQGLSGANYTQVFYVDASGDGYFAGNLNVSGSLSKGGGSFKIDDPLDPANKYLSHSFVESPDMMNVYNGVIRLDEKGEAWVTLPDYFEALNRDFRYQLTSVGAPGPNLYIAEEVAHNRFKIAGGKPGGKVSWQVTGIRQDAYANAHRIPEEEMKPATEQGFYLHPDAFGLPPERGIARAQAHREGRSNAESFASGAPPSHSQGVALGARESVNTAAASDLEHK